jgi:hypothetical protein
MLSKRAACHLIVLNDVDHRIHINAGDQSFSIEYDDIAELDGDWLSNEIGQRYTDPYYLNKDTVLIIPDSWCMAANIETKNLPRKHRVQAMDYMLEDKLPLAAEDFVADYLHCGQNGSVLGVGCEVHRLSDLITAFESNGFLISQVYPMALFVLQNMTDEYKEADGVLIQMNDHYNFIRLSEGRPSTWARMGNNINEVMLQLLFHGQGIGEPLRLLLVNVDPRDESVISKIPDYDIINNIMMTVQSNGSDIGEDTIINKNEPWINLRTGKLALPHRYRILRRPLLIFYISAILLLISLNTVFYYRAHQYKDFMAATNQNHSELITGDDRAPQQVMAQLQYEYKKLSAMEGISDITSTDSDLKTLYEIMRRLPSDLKYNIHEMRIEQQRILIEGESLSHSEASVIANALGKNPRMKVGMPRTRKLKSEGVRFTIESSYD